MSFFGWAKNKKNVKRHENRDQYSDQYSVNDSIRFKKLLDSNGMFIDGNLSKFTVNLFEILSKILNGKKWHAEKVNDGLSQFWLSMIKVVANQEGFEEMERLWLFHQQKALNKLKSYQQGIYYLCMNFEKDDFRRRFGGYVPTVSRYQDVQKNLFKISQMFFMIIEDEKNLRIHKNYGSEEKIFFKVINCESKIKRQELIKKELAMMKRKNVIFHKFIHEAGMSLLEASMLDHLDIEYFSRFVFLVQERINAVVGGAMAARLDIILNRHGLLAEPIVGKGADLTKHREKKKPKKNIEKMNLDDMLESDSKEIMSQEQIDLMLSKFSG